jgi:xanthine/CO dehydrogenase XdhC/CoxF family maturation factor
MPVTVRPASHPARELFIKPATSAQTLFEASCPKAFRQSKRIVQSSFTDLTSSNICSSSNGLVMAVYEAYSQHHHLYIRPEDIWLSILTQLSFHINAHAEDLRSFFVSHEGKKQLVVSDVGNIQTVDLGRLAVCLTEEMDKHLIDPELHEWIMPSFSTTTNTDTVTAAIIMMGSMQKYFRYLMGLICGIPSVTLLGGKADWVDIRRRLDKLPQFGNEPEQFARLLSPVLDYFIRTFEDADDPKVVDFWSKIADRHSNGSGPSYLSGWITAFCFWDPEGKSLYRDNSGDGCNLDGTSFHRVNTDDIPNAYVTVPVVVDDNGIEVKTRMVAGLVGMAASSSGEKLDISNGHKGWMTKPFQEPKFQDVEPVPGDGTGLDSLQPVAGWWMYEVEDWVKE